MFQDEHTVKTQDKKPTLAQWLKEQPKDAEPSEHIVRIIWLPGQWDNYTLETDSFRISFKRGTTIYDAIGRELDSFTKGTSGMVLHIDPSRLGTYRFSERKEAGEWFFIGTMGLRFDESER